MNKEYYDLINYIDNVPTYEMGYGDSLILSCDLSWVTKEELCCQLSEIFNQKDILCRGRLGNAKNMDIFDFTMDDSRNAVEFITKCKRVISVESGVTVEAMLWNRIPYFAERRNHIFEGHILDDVLYTDLKNIADDKEIDIKYVNVYAFLFLIPYTWFCSDSYINFLSRHHISYKQLFLTNLLYYCNQKNVSRKKLLNGDCTWEHIVKNTCKTRFFVSYLNRDRTNENPFIKNKSSLKTGDFSFINVNVIENIGYDEIRERIPGFTALDQSFIDGNYGYIYAETLLDDIVMQFDFKRAVKQFIIEVCEDLHDKKI